MRGSVSSIIFGAVRFTSNGCNVGLSDNETGVGRDKNLAVDFRIVKLPYRDTVDDTCG